MLPPEPDARKQYGVATSCQPAVQCSQSDNARQKVSRTMEPEQFKPHPSGVVPKYEWQRLYIDAVLETNRTRFLELLTAAQNAISVRLAELAQDHGGSPEENRAIEDAINGLAALRKELD
jgi:hypothetical protein